jgi:hypothetical protein
MWIFAKDGFCSIKQHNRRPDVLVVRGRVKGDLALIPGQDCG